VTNSHDESQLARTTPRTPSAEGAATAGSFSTTSFSSSLSSAREQFDGYEGEVLSMGMSNDFEVAIEEGSTMVRLGTVLLGGYR
jgi:uncharacterized pyridoxal phosphate-containing UPF0001 family protein